MKYNIKYPNKDDWTVTKLDDLELTLHSNYNNFPIVFNKSNNEEYRINNKRVKYESLDSLNNSFDLSTEVNLHVPVIGGISGPSGVTWIANTNLTSLVGNIVVVKGNSTVDKFKIRCNDDSHINLSTQFLLNNSPCAFYAQKFNPYNIKEICAINSALILYVVSSSVSNGVTYYAVNPFSSGWIEV